MVVSRDPLKVVDVQGGERSSSTLSSSTSRVCNRDTKNLFQ